MQNDLLSHIALITLLTSTMTHLTLAFVKKKFKKITALANAVQIVSTLNGKTKLDIQAVSWFNAYNRHRKKIKNLNCTITELDISTKRINKP